MSKQEQALEAAQEGLAENFPSTVVFTVQVNRPLDIYPYVNTVWEAKLVLPITGIGDPALVVESWVKMMDGAMEISKAHAGIVLQEEAFDNSGEG